MSPTNLQGLNLVQTPQPPESYLADSQDLLSLSQFPELSAQLDLWSNLAFESDEPLVRASDKKSGGESEETSHSVEDDEEDDPEDGQPAQADNHVNVVMGDPISTTAEEPRTASRPLNAFDIGNILATFGIDPFAVPVVPSTSATPSLAQILSIYQQTAQPPPPVPAVVESNTQSKGAKRARVRRSSVSKGTGDLSTDSGSPSPTDSQSGTMSTPLTAAEDKRRRNTAASARFRLKKKEREAALEKKSKELEMRVNELERECEGLRRENGWLKGLVVGVTGVGAAQQQSVPATAAGVKRPREATDSVGN
jgi:Basic region leucine zipper